MPYRTDNAAVFTPKRENGGVFLRSQPPDSEILTSQNFGRKRHHGKRRWICVLYFRGLTEREYARQLGISQKGINKRRRKVLKKLRKMMKI